MISLSPVVEGLKRVEKGVDKTASELAIARLSNEVHALKAALGDKAEPRESWQTGFFGCGGLLVIAGIVGVVGGLVGGSSLEYLGKQLVWFLVGVVLMLIGLRFFDDSAEEKQLRKAIAEKEAEIARHQKIVKS